MKKVCVNRQRTLFEESVKSALSMSTRFPCLWYSRIALTGLTLSVRSFRKPVSWDGWRDDLKLVLFVSSESGRIGQHGNHLVEFPHWPWPAVNYQQRFSCKTQGTWVFFAALTNAHVLMMTPQQEWRPGIALKSLRQKTFSEFPISSFGLFSAITSQEQGSRQLRAQHGSRTKKSGKRQTLSAAFGLHVEKMNLNSFYGGFELWKWVEFSLMLSPVVLFPPVLGDLSDLPAKWNKGEGCWHPHGK